MSFEKKITELSPDEKIKLMTFDERIRLLFTAFDLGKDKDENKKRKQNFIDLMGRYNNSLIKSEKQESGLVKGIIVAQNDRHKIHQETMLAIRSASIAIENHATNPLLHALFAFLSKDQKEVERLIVYYFSGKDFGISNSEYLNMKRGIDSINNNLGLEEE